MHEQRVHDEHVARVAYRLAHAVSPVAATLGSRLESDADGPRRSVVTNIGDGGTILPASHPTLSAIVGAQFW